MPRDLNLSLLSARFVHPFVRLQPRDLILPSTTTLTGESSPQPWIGTWNRRLLLNAWARPRGRTPSLPRGRALVAPSRAPSFSEPGRQQVTREQGPSMPSFLEHEQRELRVAVKRDASS